MAPPPNLSQNATDAQAQTYLSQYWGSAKYTNSASTPYNNKTAVQIYQYLQSTKPGDTPYQYAVAASDLMLSAGVAGTIGAAATTAGQTIGAVNTGVLSASYVPSWASGLTGLLSNLMSGAFWIRAGEVLLGLILVAVGTAHMTHAVPIATSVAKKVGMVAVA